MTIRLLIADDHELVREGLRAVFAHTRIEIVGEATTCAEAIQLADASDADVLLLDISMPDGDGFEVLRHVRAVTSLAVVMYSMHDRDHYLRRARELGASGYVTKRASSEQLVDAIDAASRGESHWSSSFNDLTAAGTARSSLANRINNERDNGHASPTSNDFPRFDQLECRGRGASPTRRLFL